jgi:glycosyltransferase involved in cell wall biosynthesis
LKKKRVHFVLCLPYTGINHSSAAVELASNFCGTALDPVLYIGQHAQSLPAGLAVVRAFPVELPGRIAYMPWVKKLAQRRIEKRLLAAIDREGPGALVWIWPGVPHALIRKLHALGAILVREMINTHVGTARRILADEAAATGYSLKAPIGVDQQEAEIADLALMRFVVSPSECVDQSLIEWGFPAERIIRSTFGWNPQSLIDQPAVAPVGAKPIALFVGTIGMRKGVHRALAAWQKADTGGSFLLVGDIEPAMHALMQEYLERPDVFHIPFARDLGRIYRSADFMFFPTLEEGAPLVCFQAAGCGLPILTGPMGASRFIENDVSGLVVDPYDDVALVLALKRMSGDAPLRAKLGKEAKQRADRLTWRDAAETRANAIVRMMSA